MDHADFYKAVMDNDLAKVKVGLREHPEYANTSFQPFGYPQYPIHIAAQLGNAELINLLAEHGAEVNQVARILEGEGRETAPRDRTALQLAYLNHALPAAIALIKQGARCYPPGDHAQKPAEEQAKARTKEQAREVTAFKAAAMRVYRLVEQAERLSQLGAPKVILDHSRPSREKFDALLAAIARSGSKLARRIPEAAPGNGTLLTDDFLAFAEVAGLACQLQRQLNWSSDQDPFRMAMDFLERTRKTWPEIAGRLRAFSPQDAADFADAVKAFTEVVVLPEFARKAKARIEARTVDIKEVIEALIPVVAETLIEKRGLAAMLDLSRDWHHRLPVLEKEIRQKEFPRTGEWLPLSPDYTAKNGLTISFVTSAQALDTLGREQKHCVGGHALDCMQSPVHIGVVKQGDTVLSTFEAEEQPQASGTLIRINQHRRAGNKAVPPQDPEEKALLEFVIRVNSGNIRPDFNAFHNRRVEIGEQAPDIRFICGFDPFTDTDGTYQTRALQQYLNLSTGGRDDSVVSRPIPFVPGGKKKWGNATATAFLEQTGIMKKIDELAAAPPRRSSMDDVRAMFVDRA